MKTYFNQVLDQYDEKLINEQLTDLPGQPDKDEDYALIIKHGNDIIKKYPLNNVENVAYSYVSFQKNRNKLNEEMDKIASSNLSRILDFYGLEHELEDFDSPNNTYVLSQKDINKLASMPDPKQHFALSNGERNYLPMDTREDFEASLKTFKKEISYLSPEIRKSVSASLVKRAEELNIGKTGLEKYASYLLAEKEDIKAALATRYMSYTDNIKLMVDTMVDNIKTANDAMSVIEIITDIDNEIGIKPQKHFDLAEKFFQTTEKHADDNFSLKLNVALKNKSLDSYLDSEVIDLLKTGGEKVYNNLNPRLKAVILNVIK